MQSTFLQSKCSRQKICHTGDWSMCSFLKQVAAFWSEMIIGVSSIGSVIWLIMHVCEGRRRVGGFNWKKDLSVSGNPLAQNVYVNLFPANREMWVITWDCWEDPSENRKLWLTIWREGRITVMTGQKGRDHDLIAHSRDVSLKTRNCSF